MQLGFASLPVERGLEASKCFYLILLVNPLTDPLNVQCDEFVTVYFQKSISSNSKFKGDLRNWPSETGVDPKLPVATNSAHESYGAPQTMNDGSRTRMVEAGTTISVSSR